MPKAILEFNLPEEREDFELAKNGVKYSIQLEDIWNKVFRPRHKHGYGNPMLDKFVSTSTGQKVMDALEELYREALRENED